MPHDLYETLGLPHDADDNAIKKAYRKLAKQFHPDVNKSPAAREKFKEVQHAYEVLSDAQKRSAYDRFGDAGLHENAEGGRNYTGPDGFNYRAGFSGEDVNLDDIFSQFFGAGTAAGRNRPQGFNWTTAGSRGTRRGPTRGQDLLHEVTIPFHHAARGGAVSLKITSPGEPKGKTLEVKIPPAIADGAKLRIRGKGHPSRDSGETGDLILTVRVAPHPFFRREGLDLFLDVPVSIDEALFGAGVKIPTLDGHAQLKVPPGTGGGKKLRLKGAGLKNHAGQTGDLLATIVVDVPETIPKECEKPLESLKGKLPNPRSRLGW